MFVFKLNLFTRCNWNAERQKDPGREVYDHAKKIMGQGHLNFFCLPDKDAFDSI